MNGIWTDLSSFFFSWLLFSGRDTGKFQWACPVSSCPPLHRFSFSINASLPDPISVSFYVYMYLYIQHSEHIQGFSVSFLSSSLSPFLSTTSLSFPCALLYCSVSLLFGWPLRKPWTRSEALLTLTLGLPVAQPACGKVPLALSAGIGSRIHVCVYGVLTNSFLLALSVALQT